MGIILILNLDQHINHAIFTELVNIVLHPLILGIGAGWGHAFKLLSDTKIDTYLQMYWGWPLHSRSIYLDRKGLLFLCYLS